MANQSRAAYRAPTLVLPWAPCQKCGAPISVDEKFAIDYLERTAKKCGSCEKEIDWWETAWRAIEQNFMYSQAFVFIGAQSSYFFLDLRPGDRTTFKFSENGIPADARILYVNYTPGPGGLFPIELHGNIPTRRFLRDEVAVYPVPFGDKLPEHTVVNVFVSWVAATAQDDPWVSLVDGFESYAMGRYASMVVPANVAVESSLDLMLTAYLERFISKERTKDFLENAASYGHQLNVLLPLLASLNSITPLPDHIRGALNRLRGLRNELAHDGVLGKPLDSHGAAELLCAALFGVHYLRYVAKRIL